MELKVSIVYWWFKYKINYIDLKEQIVLIVASKTFKVGGLWTKNPRLVAKEAFLGFIVAKNQIFTLKKS